MDRLAHGISFTDPSQRLIYSTCTKMFVDDNTNYSNKFLPWLHTPPQPTVLRDMIQHDAQTWERLLWTSGGLLKLEKCLYHLMVWTFDDEGNASLTPSSDLPSMELSSIPASPLKSHSMTVPALIVPWVIGLAPTFR